jgi:putative ABC transport system permease protein
VLRALRDIRRRKLRSALTIFGIVIGVFLLTVLGAFAEKFNKLINGGERYFNSKVVVYDANASFFSITPQPLSIDKLGPIAAVPGVKSAFPEVSMTIDQDPSGSFGPPDAVSGRRVAERDVEPFHIDVVKGRYFRDDEHAVAVVGADLAKKKKVGLGDTLKIRNHDFEVIGLLETTLTQPDSTAYVPLADAQRILYESLPQGLRGLAKPDQLLTIINVFPAENGADLETLAKQINEVVPDVKAVSGKKAFGDAVGGFATIFNAIIFGIGLIALIVGGLSVINTMFVAVNERTREIGIKRAVGATKWRIVREFLVEAMWIGLIGGLVGVILGALMTLGSNSATAASGTKIFLLTTRLIVGVLTFSTVLGVLAGLFPAIRASRLDPVTALRSE